MGVRERRLLEDLFGALVERFSESGHVMQQVPWESRGSCSPGRCTDTCRRYAALLIEASELLEDMPVRVEAVRQSSLFEDDDDRPGAG